MANRPRRISVNLQPENQQWQGNSLYESQFPHPGSLFSNREAETTSQTQSIFWPNNRRQRSEPIRQNSDREIARAAENYDFSSRKKRTRQTQSLSTTSVADNAEIAAVICGTSNHNHVQVTQYGTHPVTDGSVKDESIRDDKDTKLQSTFTYKPNRLQRRKSKRKREVSPDITAVIKQEVLSSSSSSDDTVECIENESPVAVPVPEAIIVVKQLPVAIEEPLISASKIGKAETGRINRLSLSERRDAARKDSLQTDRNNSDTNYDGFNLEGIFEWIAKQVNHTNPKSNVINRLVEILRRKEVFFLLHQELSAMRRNIYLMKSKSLDCLFSLLLKKLRAQIEEEFNSVTLEYQGVIEILSSPRSPT